MSPSGSPGYPTPLDGAVPGKPGANRATRVLDMKATVTTARGGGARRLLVGVGRGRVVGEARSNLFLLGGVAGIVGGLVLLGYGLAPVVPLVEVVSGTFGGGTPPPDLGEQIDAAMAAAKARVLVDALGFVALLAGFVLVKQALAKPKPRPVEDLVQEEVARRLAAMGAVPAPPSSPPVPGAPAVVAAAPSPAAAVQPPVAPAVAAPAQRRTHCAECGSVLVAGGRLCPQGHRQG